VLAGTTGVAASLLGGFVASDRPWLALRHGASMSNLLYYAVVFLVVALVAALFGFGGVAGTAIEGARLLFWVAIVLFIVSVVAGYLRRGRP